MMNASVRARVAIGLGLLGGFGLFAARTASRRLAVVTVAGRSMEPTLSDGDRLLAVRTPRPLRLGDMVVLEAPYDSDVAVPWHRPPAGPGETDRRWIVKRVTALAGDAVPAEAAGQVPEGETVPTGQLLVVGDNLAESYDSRQIGYIPAERIFGLVVRPLRS